MRRQCRAVSSRRSGSRWLQGRPMPRSARSPTRTSGSPNAWPPVVSPDGKWAAVQVTEPAYDERDQVSDIWIVPTDGSAPPRRLTATQDGRERRGVEPGRQRIAFAARRDTDEVAQIYVIDVAAGGEAQRVTNSPLGPGRRCGGPDGKAILFVSDVYPGARSDEENKKIGGRAHGTGNGTPGSSTASRSATGIGGSTIAVLRC